MKVLHRVWFALRALILRRRVDAELEEELAFHLERETQLHAREGMTPSDARREAVRQFGGVVRYREETRDISGVSWLGHLVSDVRHALARAPRRAPAFSATVVLTLTIGIGATAAIFTIVSDVLLRPLPFERPQRLVSITHDLAPVSMRDAGITPGMFFTYQRLAHTLSAVAAYQTYSVIASDPVMDGPSDRIAACGVTGAFMSVLGATPELGRTIGESDDKPGAPSVMVISDAWWRARFGADPHIIGRTWMLGGQRREIIGIMPPGFAFPDPTSSDGFFTTSGAATQVWVPRQLDPHAAFLGGFNSRAIARLAPGVALATAQRDLARALPRVPELFPIVAPGLTAHVLFEQAKPVARVVPLRDAIVGDVARTLWLIFAAAGLVLLVTLANVANLMLVRADARQRELSVRAAIGAGPIRVASHIVSEVAVLAGISSLLAFALAASAVRLIAHSGGVSFPRADEIHVGAATVMAVLACAALATLVCSALPVFHLVRGNAFAGLRETRTTTGARRKAARGALVSSQMALAVVALIACGLLVRSFQRLRAVNPGFDAEHVATLWVVAPVVRYKTQGDVQQFYMNLTERVQGIPGVTAAGITSRVPLHTGGRGADPVIVEGTWDPSKAIPAPQLDGTADAGYFRALRIPLIAGRLFDPPATQRWDETVINQETAKRMFGDSTGRRAIGKRFQLLPNGSLYTVVGVVGSIRDTSLFVPASGAVFMPEVATRDSIEGQFARTMAVVARTTGDLDATTRAIRAAVAEIDPTLPTFDMTPMPALVRASMARLSFTMAVLAIAAVVTLLLGIVGVYGIIAYAVTLRARELAVRLALGAAPRSLAAMIARSGATLAGVGVVAGVVLSLILARFMSAFLFDVAPADPLTIVGASAVLMLSALAASWVPARRAARLNPVDTLRTD